MAMALVDVINSGLSQIGVAPITAAEFATPVTPIGVILNRDAVNWMQSVMRAVDWSCLTARQVLQNNGSVTMTLSSAAVGTGVTATPASAYFNARDVGRTLYEVGYGLSGVYKITSLAGSPLLATGEVKAAFAGVTLLAQGWTLAPLSAWDSAYLLPSDSLKVRGIADEDGFYASWHYRRTSGSPIRWAVEGQQLLTNAIRATDPNTNASSTYPVVVYTYYESNPDNWDELLLQAVEARIAAEMAWTTKNPKLVADKWALYNAKIAEAEGATRDEHQRHGYPRTILLDVRR